MGSTGGKKIKNSDGHQLGPPVRNSGYGGEYRLSESVEDDVCDVKEQKFKYKTMIECENLDPTGLKICYATNNGE